MRNGFIDKHFSKRNNTNFDDSSSSSEEFHVGYYENFLKKLQENNQNEIDKNSNISKKKNKSSNRKKRNSVIGGKNLKRETLLKNKKFRTMLRQSLIKHNNDILKENINNENNNNYITNNNTNLNGNEDIIKLTPINEEKSDIKVDKENIKNLNKLKISKLSNNVSIQSSIDSKNSKDFNKEINSILKDVKKGQSLFLIEKNSPYNKRFSINIMRNSFFPNSNLIKIYPYKTKNFSSIKAKNSLRKASESYIKNSHSDKIRNRKEKKYNINNSLEENIKVNNHKTNLFNPQKIEIESFMNKKNNNYIHDGNKEIIKESKEENINVNNEKILTPSQDTFKIGVKKKRCLFCCLPLN